MGIDTIIGFINLKNNPFNCSSNLHGGTKTSPRSIKG